MNKDEIIGFFIGFFVAILVFASLCEGLWGKGDQLSFCMGHNIPRVECVLKEKKV